MGSYKGEFRHFLQFYQLSGVSPRKLVNWGSISSRINPKTDPPLPHGMVGLMRRLISHPSGLWHSVDFNFVMCIEMIYVAFSCVPLTPTTRGPFQTFTLCSPLRCDHGLAQHYTSHLLVNHPLQFPLDTPFRFFEKNIRSNLQSCPWINNTCSPGKWAQQSSFQELRKVLERFFGYFPAEGSVASNS